MTNPLTHQKTTQDGANPSREQVKFKSNSLDTFTFLGNEMIVYAGYVLFLKNLCVQKPPKRGKKKKRIKVSQRLVPTVEQGSAWVSTPIYLFKHTCSSEITTAFKLSLISASSTCVPNGLMNLNDSCPKIKKDSTWISTHTYLSKYIYSSEITIASSCFFGLCLILIYNGPIVCWCSISLLRNLHWWQIWSRTICV